MVLAGHSMGGTSSLLAAGRAPERVKSLVLFDPVLLDSVLRAAAAAGFPLGHDSETIRPTPPSRRKRQHDR